MVKQKTQQEEDGSDIARIGAHRKSTSSTSSSLMSISSKIDDKSIENKIKLKNKISNESKKTKINSKDKQLKIKKEPDLDTESSKLKPKVKEMKEEANENEEEDESEYESSEDSFNTKEGEEILEKLELEYLKLELPTPILRKENTCMVCEMPGSLIDCLGPCQQSAHLDCIGLLIEPKEGFKCQECILDSHPCFLCKKPSSEENQMLTKKCSIGNCGKYYHEECTQTSKLFRRENSNTTSFVCPLHSCITCYAETASENHITQLGQATKGRFVKCARCPVAYHNGEHCIAAGSMVLSSNYILCPGHYQPPKNQSKHRVNVTWCFVCCKTGDLVGCNKCPASYHSKCLKIPDPNEDTLTSSQNMEPGSPSASNQHSPAISQQHSPASNNSINTATSANTLNSAKSIQIQSNWTCEDCLIGKRPLYGQIVWAKVGNYRWWPAQICLPRCCPDNVRDFSHQLGEFPVKFFGSHDFYWLTIGRCFTFAEGDESHTSSSGAQKLAMAFKVGVREAKIAFRQLIKTNRPVGNVVVNKVRIDELPHCECDPKSASPCGSDQTCLNRMLNNECHPLACLAGERCHNQRFTKRLYPKQEPVYTGERGWGLRCLVDIKKGEFVNEYVGELINDEECKRRLEQAHQNDCRNFYFLTIEKDRIIDAGPKGNISRFANHSCEPNMETQKWCVNGDDRVGLFAVCDIPAFTELTFNYNLDCLSNQRAVCRCGANNCSGFIGARPKNNNNSNDTRKSQSNTSLKNNNNNQSANTNQSAVNGNTKKRKLSETAKLSRLSIGGLENAKPFPKNSKARSFSLTPKEFKNLKNEELTPSQENDQEQIAENSSSQKNKKI